MAPDLGLRAIFMHRLRNSFSGFVCCRLTRAVLAFSDHHHTYGERFRMSYASLNFSDASRCGKVTLFVGLSTKVSSVSVSLLPCRILLKRSPSAPGVSVRRVPFACFVCVVCVCVLFARESIECRNHFDVSIS